MEKVALFAGNGSLPQKLIHHFQYHSIDFIILAFEGMTDPSEFQEYTVLWHTIGHVETLLGTLRTHAVTHIVMAGQVHRPSLSSFALDWLGAKWIARMGLAALGGDDALLSKLIRFLEEEGFIVVSPHSILSDLTCEAGLLTTAVPTGQSLHDIHRGQAILNALSPHDVGQAIVVQEGIVLGVEAAEGTAGLLDRVKHLKRESHHRGVLVKLAKRKQSLLVDLPTIGHDTILQVIDAELEGIAVSAHTTQILDRKSVIDMCNARGLFLLVIESEEA